MKYVLNQETLSDDYYAVFNNITKYSYLEKEDIDTELKTKHSQEEIKKLLRFFDDEQFRIFKKDKIKKNTKSFGIPQGAGISSVCSNIYLLDFDRKINEYVKNHEGMYRRYCDDLIIVIPIDEENGEYNHVPHKDFLNYVINEIPNLSIQEEKTGQYLFSNNEILKVDNTSNSSRLDYLGFTFDGHNVRVRDKSLFKFYNRAYRKVRICNKKSKEYGRKTYRRGLYENYTHLGKRRKGHGNFLSYISRAQKAFDSNSITNNLMEHQVKNHWNRITVRLDP
ncbi:reverse transcriptase domain-containing protein [Paenibacillus sp. MCAF9]|uniref:reverse transcriptase domain-containing protein n=1 Tax=Paenibacillus sp. MCAF9 TaxID=3233046 RepID=UPI003F9C2FF0